MVAAHRDLGRPVHCRITVPGHARGHRRDRRGRHALPARHHLRQRPRSTPATPPPAPRTAPPSHAPPTPPRPAPAPRITAASTGPGAAITTHPPRQQRDPHSNAEASNATGACTSTRRTRRPTRQRSAASAQPPPRCVTATPLGTPVDPDVYITYARSSGPTPAPHRSARPPGQQASAVDAAGGGTPAARHPATIRGTRQLPPRRPPPAAAPPADRPRQRLSRPASTSAPAVASTAAIRASRPRPDPPAGTPPRPSPPPAAPPPSPPTAPSAPPPPAPARAQPRQARRQPPRRGIQLRVRPRSGPADHRHRSGVRAACAANSSASVRRHRRRRVVPAPAPPAAARPQPAPPARSPAPPGQPPPAAAPGPAGPPAPRPYPVEQVRRVTESPPSIPAGRAAGRRRRSPRLSDRSNLARRPDRASSRSAGRAAPSPALRAGDVLEGEHDLEQRVAGQRPGRGQVLHQPLERQVLVGVGARPASRTRPSSSANVGSPDTSVRSTSVLTKNPTRSSSAASVRPGHRRARPGYRRPRPAGTAAPPARPAAP